MSSVSRGMSANTSAAANTTITGSSNTDNNNSYGSNGTLLYHQTIIPSQAITHVLAGSFTLPGAHDLILIRHNVLELWNLSSDMNTVSGNDSNAETVSMRCVHRLPLLVSVLATVAVPTSRAFATERSTKASSTLSEFTTSNKSNSDITSLRKQDAGMLHYVALTSESGYVTLFMYKLNEPPVPARLPVQGATEYTTNSNTDPNYYNNNIMMNNHQPHHAMNATSTSILPSPGLSMTGSHNTHDASQTILITTSLRGYFVKLSEIQLGRSGVRLTMPSAQMVVDHNGQALFIAALMRNKVIVPLARNEGYNNEEDKQTEEYEIYQNYYYNNNNNGNGSSETSAIGTEALLNGKQRWQRREQRAIRGVLTLTSPLEIVRQTITYSICEVEGVLENTTFAALEEEVIEASTTFHHSNSEGTTNSENVNINRKSSSESTLHTRRKVLVVYVYVASLRQVQRTHLLHVPYSAHRIISLPEPPNGPGGVLVCCESELIWYDLTSSPSASSLLVQPQPSSSSVSKGAVNTIAMGVFKCAAAIPRRIDYAQTLYEPSIIASACTKVGKSYFALIQDEHGDLFRIILSRNKVQEAYDALRLQQQQQQLMNLQNNSQSSLESNMIPHSLSNALANQTPISIPNPLSVHYYESSAPCTAMVLCKNGLLFMASESASMHVLYKVISNGYNKESEYIVKRVKRILRSDPMLIKNEKQPSAAMTTTSNVKKESKEKEEKEEEKKTSAASVKVKTEKENELKNNENNTMTNTKIKQEKKDDDGNEDDDDDDMAMPAPKLTGKRKANAEGSHTLVSSSSPESEPPEESTRQAIKKETEDEEQGEQEEQKDDEKRKKSANSVSNTNTKTDVIVTRNVRVISVYEPHHELKHMKLVQSLPHTPAITSFAAQVPSYTEKAKNRNGNLRNKSTAHANVKDNNNNDDGEDEESDDDENSDDDDDSEGEGEGTIDNTIQSKRKLLEEESQKQQEQVEFNLIAGRGSDSVLCIAKYGFTTRRTVQFILPTTFSHVFALVSAARMQVTLYNEAHALEQLARSALEQQRAYFYQHHQQQMKEIKFNAAALESYTRQRQAAARSIWHDKLVLSTAAGTVVFTISYTPNNTVNSDNNKSPNPVASLQMDTLSGFITSERTLASSTLPLGRGYVQITTRGIYILPSNVMDEVLATVTTPSSYSIDNLSSITDPSAAPLASSLPSYVPIEPMEPHSWIHPHGKPIIAAAVNSTCMLVSFGANGGVASFDFGLTSKEFRQVDMQPTFTMSPAVSLLQSSTSSSSFSSSSLTRSLFDIHNASFMSTLQECIVQALQNNSTTVDISPLMAEMMRSSSSEYEQEQREVSLAAIATVNQEVLLVQPHKLNKTLQTIARGESECGAIASVLLTYFGTDKSTHASLLSSLSSRHKSGIHTLTKSRLFCLIGHVDGTLARYELDPHTLEEIDNTEVVCGSAPCYVIHGLHGVCYVQSGTQYWRCHLSDDGSLKTIPWRFPSSQTTFAPLAPPQLSSSSSSAVITDTTKTSTTEKVNSNTKNNNNNVIWGANMESVHDTSHDDNSSGSTTTITTTNAPRILNLLSDNTHEEYVVGVHGHSLNLFVATEVNEASSQSLEFSFDKQLLPVAGRTIVRHPTRPSYYIVAGRMHRALHPKQQQQQQQQKNNTSARLCYRSLGKANHYVSSIQLYHASTRRLLPPYQFSPDEAIQAITIGSFRADFGKEPVVIVSAAPKYTHGSYFSKRATFSQGWLHTFRFDVASSTMIPSKQKINSHESHKMIMMNADGSAVLKLKPVHSTLLRPYPVSTSSTGEVNSMENSKLASNVKHTSMEDVEVQESLHDYASALHICEPVGLLFVGLGARNGLWVYTWGMKHLLRKRHLPHAPSRIIAIDTVFITPPWYEMVVHSTNTNASSPFYASDVYRCRMDDSSFMEQARSKQLLIICATLHHSVFIATLLPGSGRDLPSYLMYIAHDALLPRSLTCMSVIDERTIAIGDRLGNVAILRIPPQTRFALSERPEQLREAEINSMMDYFKKEQLLDEVAVYQTGSVLTSLTTMHYDPSHGEDAQLETNILFYSTSRGSIGALLPFLSEEDASLAAYIQPIIASHIRCSVLPYNGAIALASVGSTGLSLSSMANNRLHDTLPVHHVIDGDLLRLFLQSYNDENTYSISNNVNDADDGNDDEEDGNEGNRGNSNKNMQVCCLFSNSARMAVERELARVKKIEATRRKVLNLPPRELPSVSELAAKMRALVTLPL